MSNPEKDSLLIEGILEMIASIELYCGDIGEYEFYQNDMLKDAVLMKLILIGESVKNLSDVFKAKNTEVDWNQIKAARNFYVHQYGNIDWTSVWAVKHEYLPVLKSYIDKII